MRGALAAAAANPVFANLLMVFLIVAGAVSVTTLRRELFPEFSFDKVTVRVLYPGATPAEIEDSVTVKIEEAIRGQQGVRKVESVSSEGLSTVTIEIDAAVVDPRDALVDIRNDVNQITTFPSDTEEPEVELVINRRNAISLVLAGDVDERSLTELALDLEDELLLLDGVSEVTVEGTRPYEITVSVREADLQRYGLTFDQVVAAVSGGSVDLPLGKLRSDKEEQLLRVQRERERGREYARIPLVSRDDGTRITLGQVATIDDGFDEDEKRVRVDGQRGVFVSVLRDPSEDAIRVAREVERWVEARRASLPPGVALDVWEDNSENVVGRLTLLAENGALGLVLVFVILLVFLGWRLSFWVAFGLPVAFMAALTLLQGFGGSLNMVSSFALIMILGILVDDSIVVGENIARHLKEGGYTLAAGIRGLQEVAWPVIASVTTTAVAFLPLMFVGGTIGKFIRIMPVAVVACLIASLIECLLILPAHLAHVSPPDQASPRRQSLRERIDAWVDRFVQGRYGQTVDWAVANRYPVAAASAGFVILMLGLVAGGRPGFVFFPRLEGDYITADVTMPQGTALPVTETNIRRLEASAMQLRQSFPPNAEGEPVVRRILTKVGQSGVHTGTVQIELARSEDRDVSAIQVLRRWEEISGKFPTASSVIFQETTRRPGGRPIELRILADDEAAAADAAEQLRGALADYPGVFNLDDNLDPGKRELSFDLRPAAESLGVSLRDLAGQLYSGLSGREVNEIQRGRDEVEVRVRYAPDERQRQSQLADMRIRLGAEGELVPLGWAATIERGRSLSKIERRDGRRFVLVSADVDDGVTNANSVVSELKNTTIKQIEAENPQVEFVFGGAQEEQQETMTSLAIGFLVALFGIYTILSLLFKSYIQALVVMGAIPVGFGGAILGHVLLGRPVTMFSIFGMIGLTGIVVNDALVLIDFINRQRREQGIGAFQAACNASRVRFRAVFLTTFTTVAGLFPLLLEKSRQAQFLIPMAISIAAGVAVATVITLYVVPAVYMIVEDLRRLFVIQTPRRANAAAEPPPPGPAGPA